VRIADRSNDPQSSRDAWTFSTIDAAIDAVLYQVGFGWLPEERIGPQLQQGVLKALPLGHGARRATPLHLIVKRDLTPIDEQVATLLDLFRSRYFGCCALSRQAFICAASPLRLALAGLQAGSYSQKSVFLYFQARY
jgi:DNA-binding transcriptional LysR family regulator